MHISKTWRSVIIWSIISAAFIGPGTVTTAVSGGSMFKLDLLWAVTFATIACVVLQEVAARVVIASGISLGQALIVRFGTRGGQFLQWLVGGTVILGCAAYEAGNIMGAVAGIQLMTGFNTLALTVIVTAASALVLWNSNPAWISSFMTFLVALMGVAFIALAFTQSFPIRDVLQASILPSIPFGSELTVLGLIGTTVVPYNVFLGSGIAKGQSIPLMRVGLVISILTGGLITAAIVVAGTAITDFSSFHALFAGLNDRVGKAGAIALALGLFGAGFSSAITSPYASAIIVKTVFNEKKERTIKLAWSAVLFAGFVVSVSGLKPIPVILFVQAMNGLILPFVVIFLLLVVNDPRIIPLKQLPGRLYNGILLIMLSGIVMISLVNINKSVIAALGLSSNTNFIIVTTVSILVASFTGWAIFRIRMKKTITTPK